MSTLRVVTVIGVLFLFLLLQQFPGRVVAVLLPSTVQLEGVTGTLWQGTAARAAVIVEGKRFVLGRLSWHLEPLSLLSLRPSINVSSVWGSQRFDGRVAAGLGGSASLEDVSLQLDVRFLRNLMPLYVGGQIQITLDQARVDDGQLTAVDARVVWQDAVWAARQGDVALGNYALDVSGNDGAIKGSVITLSGPLVVAGELAFEGRDWQVDLDVSGPAVANEGLRPSLMLFGVPTDNGFDVVLDGQL